jgi:hypothetical protein
MATGHRHTGLCSAALASELGRGSSFACRVILEQFLDTRARKSRRQRVTCRAARGLETFVEPRTSASLDPNQTRAAPCSALSQLLTRQGHKWLPGNSLLPGGSLGWSHTQPLATGLL